jgi:hypothetical protein
VRFGGCEFDFGPSLSRCKITPPGADASGSPGGMSERKSTRVRRLAICLVVAVTPLVFGSRHLSGAARDLPWRKMKSQESPCFSEFFTGYRVRSSKNFGFFSYPLEWDHRKRRTYRIFHLWRAWGGCLATRVVGGMIGSPLFLSIREFPRSETADPLSGSCFYAANFRNIYFCWLNTFPSSGMWF